MFTRRQAMFASGTLLAGPVLANAPEWPTKPVRLVVPFPPGGASDIIGRVLGDVLARRTNHSFIIENRPGALTTVASEYVMRAAPDGHTLLINSAAAYSLNPHVMTMRYDPMKDVPPLTTLASTQQVLVVASTRNFRTLGDLFAWGKANPAELNFGTVGIGTINHLLAVMLLRQAALKAEHASYAGAPATITGIMGGEVLATVAGVPAALTHIQTGKLAALCVFSQQRSPFLPDVSTAVELGYPVSTSEADYGLFTPAKMPRALGEKIRSEVTVAMEDASLHERFKKLCLIPRTSTPEQFRALIEADSNKLGPVARELGIRTN